MILFDRREKHSFFIFQFSIFSLQLLPPEGKALFRQKYVAASKEKATRRPRGEGIFDSSLRFSDIDKGTRARRRAP